METTWTRQRYVPGEAVVEIDFAFVEFELAGESAGLLDRRREFRDHGLWTAPIGAVGQFDARQLAQDAHALSDRLGLERCNAGRVEPERDADGRSGQVGGTSRIHLQFLPVKC